MGNSFFRASTRVRNRAILFKAEVLPLMALESNESNTAGGGVGGGRRSMLKSLQPQLLPTFSSCPEGYGDG